jgi:heptaprenyl diphosphate synthase
MTILYKKFFKYFSIPAISISGAIFHNLGQITVASLIMENFNLFYYLPVLLISGIITGFFIGLIVKLLVKPLESVFQATETKKLMT